MPDRQFEIGLTMAGAISAGAYSGGVFDFLIQALHEFEKDKAANPDIMPNHTIVLKTMSGASAGSITGAVGVIALAGGLNLPASGVSPLFTLPTLYDAWVIKPQMALRGSGKTDLLALDDLESLQKGEKVLSILNCQILDDIRDEALRVSPTGMALPYIAKDLHLFMTTTNLRGVPYKIEFKGGHHEMLTHGDRIHYCIQDLGNIATVSQWAAADGGTPISVLTLHSGSSIDDWKNVAEASLASAAFPAGLKPRIIETNASLYNKRQHPVEVSGSLVPLPPAFPTGWPGGSGDFKYVSLDGGVVNNEPFEIARYALRDKSTVASDPNGARADRAVIMIDPFPDPPDFDNSLEIVIGLVPSIKRLLPTLIDQARFKLSELVVASDEKYFSRFLVKPVRYETKPGTTQETRAEYAIASGLLGGFGGFLDQSFREHDYQLGRRNCQKFLMDQFALPANNIPIVSKCYLPLTNHALFSFTDPGTGEVFYPIIPLRGSALPPVPVPPWPRMSQRDFDYLQERIEKRYTKLIATLVKTEVASWIVRTFARVVLSLAKSRILDTVRWIIMSDLIRRDQIEGWAFTGTNADAARKVAAELANSQYDARTPESIARSTALDVGTVKGLLNAFVDARNQPYRTWTGDLQIEGKGDLYTLYARKPNWFRKIPLIGDAVMNFVSEPVVD